jgi:thiazole/oxazole-forming peptide maturase SagD family component
MRLASASLDLEYPLATQQLLERVVSPVCGLAQMLVVVLRGRREPRFFISAAQLTGVHVLLGQAHAGSYHIGGSGLRPHEALIRTLGESIERYAQFISGVSGQFPTRLARYADLRAQGDGLVPERSLQFFAPAQYALERFPFHPFSTDAPIGWLRARSLITDQERWVPAQLVLVGYAPRRRNGEPWLLPAVTTGSAAHTSRSVARRNALLELIQIDAAIGHWYSDRSAPEILLDRRTELLERLLRRHISASWPRPRFFWLESPELPAVVVACVLRRPTDSVPALAVGAGVDTRLVPAMYRALLEAVGVMQLAKVNMVNAKLDTDARQTTDASAMFDLDSNVAYYAAPENGDFIEEKFTYRGAIAATDLPPDSVLSTDAENDVVVDSFARAGMELVELDLTTPDIAALGFVALRAWSPELLSMPLPSAPPLNHPRFAAYGGATHQRPHPYP